MKKSVLAILTLAFVLNSCISALAYTFPEPDWGALLNERKSMVTETDFELYAEGKVESALYYGAKFELRGGAYLGSVAEYAQKLLPLSSYLTYIEHMSQDDLYYPANQMIENDNVISMVGWTVHDMNTVDYNQVRKVLDNLNKYNKPMLIRFANEMNCSGLGNDPNLYINVFRKVADMIHEYPNFAVVWSPNDMGSLDRPFEYFYPGDEYVDWIGLSCYSTKYFRGEQNTAYKDSVYFMTGDYAWPTNKVKPLMKFLKDNNIKKPVMISEGGISTSNKYGENLEAWSTPRLRNMLWYLTMKYPQIKMINYFDVHRDGEAERFDITNSYPYAVDIFNEAKNSGTYIKEYGKSPEFVYKKAEEAGTLTAENGKVILYTLSHIPGYTDYTVNYSVDGVWHGSSPKIPYRCVFDISNISDGKHTLTISTLDKKKDYVFYKNGSYIRFGAEPEVQISVTLNADKIEFDQPPIIKDNRTLVPLRKIFEALGADVEWEQTTQTVTSVKGEKVIKVTIGSDRMYINGNVKILDVPAQIVNDRTLVPVRAIAEAFGCNVEWEQNTKTVKIIQ